MNDSMQYPPLARLLALNNRVHDLENGLRQELLPALAREYAALGGSPPFSRIAEMQEEMDQSVRASLMTCWLGMPEEPAD